MRRAASILLALAIIATFAASQTVSLASPTAQGQREVTALVGAGQDVLQVFGFFPHDLVVHAGDTVTWKINGDEIHTASFNATLVGGASGGIQDPPGPGGQMIPGFFAHPPSGPDDLELNPLMVFPTRFPGAPVETFSSDAFLSSGLLAKQPAPGAPPNDSFSLTFPTPGTFSYICIVHPDQMNGKVIVLSASADVPSQGDIDAAAQAEIAPLIALVTQAQAEGEMFTRREAGPGGTTFAFVRAGNSELVTGDPGIQVFDFMPKNVTVKTGDTVIWGATYFHTVSFVPRPPNPDLLNMVPQAAGPPRVFLNPVSFTPARPSPTFDPTKLYNSADIGAFSPGGFSWALTFDKPGTYEYVCLVHVDLGMKGTVTVVSK